MTNNSKADTAIALYNNWAFDKSCLQRILQQDLKDKPRGEKEDVVFELQKLLEHMMEAFDLSNQDQLFDFIKSHTDFWYGIDFMQLQQILVFVDREMWGTEYRKKQINRFLTITNQAVEYLIKKQYLPDAKLDELNSRTKDISKYEMHKNTSKAAKIKREMETAVEEEAYQRIKSKFANEGMQMFVDPDYPNHKPKYADKIAFIMDYGTLVYQDGKKCNLGKRLAMRFYIRLMEENGITVKQNAKKKRP